ncbi:type VI secretion system baseplate subunit TssE [Spartinivicinus poritis]|uniref:Type VI secretion system baseplate subunit TssE n=1 Tax=Spartinivicinus poritis TaxID=2994640 RepID=A0ABT5UA44_9GAMM|nr:type VI secretion system baseplate subunit TssE [Spartinivicinus sp. A2-2]MDE1463251.1 type VI secretion system baseplate subunit TssE [Spartinivicinus sp. A2-2]
MASELRLFERIQSAETKSHYTMAFDERKLHRSVLAHVQEMLNVREGSVMALPEYGMPDFNDLVSQFPDAISEIKKAIEEFLTEYEPRLSSIRVKHYDDPDNPLVLRFHIVADIQLEDQKTRITFETELAGTGHATVKG